MPAIDSRGRAARFDHERHQGHTVKAIPPHGMLLVCEMVMPETPEPSPAKFMDLNMLAMTEGGAERTEREFAALFESAGLRLTPVSIVEGTTA